MSVQTSDGMMEEGQARGFVEVFTAGGLTNFTPDLIGDLISKALPALPDEERRRWWRKHRGEVRRALLGEPLASRSAVHVKIRTQKLMVVLHERGLVDLDRDCRDKRTNRKVRSLLYELARLPFASDDEMVSAYEELHGLPLREVKAIVGVILADRATVRSLDDHVP